MDEKLSAILSKAVEAYGCDGVLEDYIKLPKGEFGDGLAQFIVREAIDVHDPAVSEDKNVAEMVKALDLAISQIEAVKEAINPKAQFIKRFLREGEVASKGIGSVEVLGDVVGRMLDKAYANDIIGDCAFEAENGKVYVCSIELDVREASPEYAAEAIAEAVEEGIAEVRDEEEQP